ncbi:Hypothetical predicted protein [Olea europaea subsp. europaea]|uniref:Uncharacterized protein n=1 Tax=Olea europaea subsp. europaea TaxID=158383 RepID=A0A8S0RNP5_OLEEU|nr:Hypothetical predicted protein [Olea europaea subsp. europaea]
MGAGKWCCCCNDVLWGGRLDSFERFTPFDLSVNNSKAPIWTMLWRKIKKEKKRKFSCSNAMRFTYDPYSYAQNFDQGLMWANHDELSRSFSARFAVPSRIFEKNEVMV